MGANQQALLAGTTVVISYATLDSNQTSSHIVLSGGKLIATKQTVGYVCSTRDTIALGSGNKRYCELTMTAIGTGVMVGTCTTLPTDGVILGFTAAQYGYDSATGKSFNNNSGVAYGAAFTTGDVMSIVVDGPGGTIVFWKNGATQGTAYSGVSGTNYICAALYDSAVVTANFGGSAWAYSPPAGFSGIH